MEVEKLKEQLATTNAISLGKSKQPDVLALKAALLEHTAWCPENYSIATRIFVTMNDVVEVPRCVCGEPCVPNKLNNKLGFTEYCSTECMRQNRLSPEVKEKLSSRDWLYEERIVRRKSKESIAASLGISTVPVNRWIKIHGIENVQYNQSEASIREKLGDKQFMESEYSSGLTCQEIAERIGSSASTVCKFLEKHGVTMRLPNEYDRVGGISGEEQSIVDFLRTFFDGEIIQSSRKILGDGREIDIFIPEKNFAIEYNGIYSHLYRPEENSYSKKKDNSYHISKTEICTTKGIQLVHIFSDQWKHKRNIVENLIRTKMGMNQLRIGARQCTVMPITPNQKKVFLDEHHLFGNDHSTHALGTFHEGELVAVMTFGTPRFTKKYDWELIRFCVKGGLVVSGGFTKMISKFRQQFSGSIVSYADRSVSDGGVYAKNGFVLVETNSPTAWNVDFNRGIRTRRTSMMKKRMVDELGGGQNYSEVQLKEMLGVQTIFDCGTLTYVME